MSMNPIFKVVVAALLLTGSAAGALLPALDNTPAATPAAEISVQTPEGLTASEAAAIALADAGLAEEDVTRMKTHRDVDDGVPEWEVDFRCGDWEYDYTIHAETGTILERDKEYDPPKTVTEPAPTQPVETEPAPTAPPATEPTPTEPPATEPVLLTAEEALAIALADAGLTSGEITGLKTKKELDDGRPEWEVDFRFGDWEYDYTIHAETGTILERDKEYDPPKTVTEPAPTQPVETEPTPTEPPATEPVLLTAEEALAIALADAGLTSGEITGLKTKKELDDGRPEWEVDFRCGDWEYDYTIHAETGTILERDKEYDPPKTVTEPAPTQPVETEPAPTEPPATEPAPTEAPATEPAPTEAPATESAPTEPPATEPVLLTAEEALAIALTHAGLTAEEVDFHKTELDYDDGRAEYEVELYAGAWEYSYEIEALTGRILEWEKEIDD